MSAGGSRVTLDVGAGLGLRLDVDIPGDHTGLFGCLMERLLCALLKLTDAGKIDREQAGHLLEAIATLRSLMSEGSRAALKDGDDAAACEVAS